jgi:RAD51-like protein 2
MAFPTTTVAQLLQERHRYSTGSTPVDQLTDGGVARGNILEIAGPPGCGREGILLGLVESALRNGDDVLFFGGLSSKLPNSLTKGIDAQ